MILEHWHDVSGDAIGIFVDIESLAAGPNSACPKVGNKCGGHVLTKLVKQVGRRGKANLSMRQGRIEKGCV